MALRPVPPSDTYPTTGTATQGRPAKRTFAELYRQARTASVNDNAADNAPQDGGADNGGNDQARLQQNEQNRKYIDGLHERVDTLRGEILVRVIQAKDISLREKLRVDQDISRLSARLDGLREKLKQEETRLSGKLIDVET